MAQKIILNKTFKPIRFNANVILYKKQNHIYLKLAG